MKTLLAILVLFLATPIWAADGDACPSDVERVGKYCTILCDTKVAASGSCADYTLPKDWRQMVFHVATETACSGDATATVTTTSGQAGDSSSAAIVTLNNASGTVVALHESTENPVLPVLEVALSTMTACTDYTVYLHVGK
jgi:hypothetical protein